MSARSQGSARAGSAMIACRRARLPRDDRPCSTMASAVLRTGAERLSAAATSGGHGCRTSATSTASAVVIGTEATSPMVPTALRTTSCPMYSLVSTSPTP